MQAFLTLGKEQQKSCNDEAKTSSHSTGTVVIYTVLLLNHFCIARKMANKLTPEQITEYKGVFEMFDEEGNGDVKTQELERLMSLMGINPTKRELSQMAKDVDKDGKGVFNCDSFLGLMALFHERTKNQDAELRAAFKVFDKEAKGYIDWNTLKYVLMNAGEPLNETEAEQMMKEADKDGDGTIDYEEFVAMMTGNLFKMS
ncbi:hypothetical protein LDENG_00006900 [Lucifuga dentata]|nr:hypothetical protein LDENG_00006900 [Lucifuga dentata]